MKAFLRISGQDVPLAEEPQLNVAGIYSFLNRSAGGYVTTTLTIPATPEALRLLGAVEIINRANPLTITDAYLFTPALVIEGRLQVTRVTYNTKAATFEPQAIEATFAFDAAPWLTALADKPWRDVQGLTSTDWTEVNVQALADADPDADPDAAAALVRWADWNAVPLTHRDFTPVLFLKALLKRAFEELGYTITGPFFDSPLMQRLAVPLAWRQYSAKWLLENVEAIVWRSFEQSIDKTGASSGWSEVAFLSVLEGASGVYEGSPNYRYTCPYNGWYNVAGLGYYTLDGVSGTSFTPLQIRKNGVVVTDFAAGILQYEGECQAGDVFEWDIWTEGGFVTRVQPESRGIVRYSPVNPNTGEPIDGAPMVPNQLAPEDWTVGALIDDLTTMFNLCWRTLPGRKVEVWPADTATYYPWDGSPAVTIAGLYDVDPLKIDAEVLGIEAAEYPDEWGQGLILSYRSDDPTVDAIDADADLKGGEGLIVLDPSGRRYTAERKTVRTKLLAKSLTVIDRDIRHPDSDISPAIMAVTPSDVRFATGWTDRNTDGPPRIALFEGRRAGRDGYVQVTWTPDPYDHPALFFFNWNDNNGVDLSLMFGEETTATAYQVEGLALKFHRHQWARLKTWRKASILCRYEPGMAPGAVVTVGDTVWVVQSVRAIKGGLCRLEVYWWTKAGRELNYVEGGAPRLIKEN